MELMSIVLVIIFFNLQESTAFTGRESDNPQAWAREDWFRRTGRRLDYEENNNRDTEDRKCADLISDSLSSCSSACFNDERIFNHNLIWCVRKNVKMIGSSDYTACNPSVEEWARENWFRRTGISLDYEENGDAEDGKCADLIRDSLPSCSTACLNDERFFKREAHEGMVDIGGGAENVHLREKIRNVSGEAHEGEAHEGMVDIGGGAENVHEGVANIGIENANVESPTKFGSEWRETQINLLLESNQLIDGRFRLTAAFTPCEFCYRAIDTQTNKTVVLKVDFFRVSLALFRQV
ncbi:hypothetical protein Ddc_18515 [Ditylenchus destructor]|nr:hypothetical protein Ddc_18515 [Ditylenchus destructor]